MRLNPFFQPFSPRGLGLESLFGFSDESLSAPNSTRVRRTESGLEVRAYLPGVAPEDLEIEVEGRWLTLRGKSQAWADEQHEAEAPAFRRRYQLPFPVDGEASTAKLEHGVLTLQLPRPADHAPRRIPLEPSGAVPEIAGPARETTAE